MDLQRCSWRTISVVLAYLPRSERGRQVAATHSVGSQNSAPRSTLSVLLSRTRWVAITWLERVGWVPLVTTQQLLIHSLGKESEVNRIYQFVEITTLLREITCHIGSHGVTCYPAVAIGATLPQKLVVTEVGDICRACGAQAYNGVWGQSPQRGPMRG